MNIKHCFVVSISILLVSTPVVFGANRIIKRVTNSLNMKFIYIAPGEFIMGSPLYEPKRDSHEKQYKVILSEGFYMQATEVTVGQWRRFINATGYKTEAEQEKSAIVRTGNEKVWELKEDAYWDNPYFQQSEKNPVTCVSWNDTQRFIKWLNRQGEGEYQLPTEAQWEYACRSGTKTPFAFGKCLSTDQANYLGYEPMPGCSKGRWLKKTIAVASFEPNKWGLYDMHGNVWEWCQDRYGDYPSGEVINPQGVSLGSERVLRGGGWYGIAKDCRSAYRDGIIPIYRDAFTGFRLILLTGH